MKIGGRRGPESSALNDVVAPRAGSGSTSSKSWGHGTLPLEDDPERETRGRGPDHGRRRAADWRSSVVIVRRRSPPRPAWGYNALEPTQMVLGILAVTDEAMPRFTKRVVISTASRIAVVRIVPNRRSEDGLVRPLTALRGALAGDRFALGPARTGARSGFMPVSGPVCRWPSCWRSPTRRRPSGSTSVSKWSVVAPIEADRWVVDAGDVLGWLDSAAAGTDDVVRLVEEER